ncbi:MAG: serine/threonine-protein kinase [Armatimonadota bacterium]|nr:serine/threonine-protein kinase [bacterium]
MSTSSTNTLGKYQIVREIARSNDIVYEAVDPSINRRVALKELCIPPNVTAGQKRERIERFLREGRAAGKLAHPNIVTIYDVGKDNDRYYIAMEFLTGQTLRDVLQAGGALSINDAVNYTLQLCDALSYAHENGVIHRDIKPDNVQILPGGHVKLTDFGIARMMGESSITQDGQVFGTPSYMSPEQVAGKKLDTRSDIFSVGVMLYEMIAGKKPFAGDSVVTITYNIVNMEAPPPPGAPPYIVGIIRKAMAKDVDARYQSIDLLAEDLREQKSSGVFLPGPTSAPAWLAPQSNGNVQDPFGQPSTPVTPYGTPVPSTNAGSASSSAPDPFAQNAPVQAPMPPALPPMPMMSAETRNFLGVFLLLIALIGMLFFAGWAVNLAYKSYRTSVTSDVAGRYFEQGEKLYASGKPDRAVNQWRNAARVSPYSQYAKRARDRIYEVSVVLARRYYDSRDVASLKNVSQLLIESNPDRPEGHFYLAAAYHFGGDFENAKPEYARAIQYGGNDSYAQAARANLGSLYLYEGDKFAAAGQRESAISSYENAKQYGNSSAMQIAEDRISRLR